MNLQRSKKVMAPIEGKNGKTFWLRVGNAWINRDESIQVWLHAFPTGGVIQIRDLDENDLKPKAPGPSEEKGEAAESVVPF